MEDKYFKQALSDFTIEFASGEAIRSLSDKGYSVKKIKSKLDFPTPEERIREIVWKHYIDNKTICLQDPKETSSVENYTIKKVYDSYGRPSFKKVSVKADEEAQVLSRSASRQMKKSQVLSRSKLRLMKKRRSMSSAISVKDCIRTRMSF